jgi:hypothetical protein
MTVHDSRGVETSSAAAYKLEKEAFVTGYAGGSPLEILFISLIPVVRSSELVCATFHVTAYRI